MDAERLARNLTDNRQPYQMSADDLAEYIADEMCNPSTAKVGENHTNNLWIALLSK